MEDIKEIVLSEITLLKEDIKSLKDEMESRSNKTIESIEKIEHELKNQHELLTSIYDKFEVLRWQLTRYLLNLFIIW